ncbi:sporozoite surface protein 2-like [Drosophila biarmipes]|uniref:sporozoite surface protein 2-like n=1 Tax=Drosophila biarmipes TaxID=125945 RepID=UPI001CDA75CF|nr:sporozoite surface protein 2-like [Drosophila biarmipes]
MSLLNCISHCYHMLLQERAARQFGRHSQHVAPRQATPAQEQVARSATSQRNHQVDPSTAREPNAPSTNQESVPPTAPHQQEASSGPGNPRYVPTPQQHVAPTDPSDPHQVALMAPAHEKAPQQHNKPRVVAVPPDQRVGPSNSQPKKQRSPRQVAPPIPQQIAPVAPCQRAALGRRVNFSTLLEVIPVAPRQGELFQEHTRSSILDSPIIKKEVSQPREKWNFYEIYQQQQNLAIKSTPMRYQVESTNRKRKGQVSQIQDDVTKARAKNAYKVSPPGSQPPEKRDFNEIYQRQQNLAIKSEPMRHQVEPTQSKRNGKVQEKKVSKKKDPKGILVAFDKGKKETMMGLWMHIARNIKRGQYDLKPVKKGQCPTCRRLMSCGLAPHQATCRPEMYTLGCPCGYLCATIESLNGHHASCDFYLEKFAFAGTSAFHPYISEKWRKHF